MRHGKSGRKFNRTSSHRDAMLRNRACSLIKHEQINTPRPKAKELRRVVEPLITLGKTANLANRRLAFSRLRDREMVGKLFDDLGVRFKARPGGYIRLLKMGFRPGDAAPVALVQLVDRAATKSATEETSGAEGETKKGKKKAAAPKAKSAKSTKKAKAKPEAAAQA